MASREKQRRIDAQWQTLQPFWGKKDYEGERKMLYDLLEPGEDVELLHSCGFETKNVAWGSRHDRGGRGRYRAPDNLAEPGPVVQEPLWV